MRNLEMLPRPSSVAAGSAAPAPATGPTFYYRYTDRRVSPYEHQSCVGSADYTPRAVDLDLQRYEVVNHTAKGVRILVDTYIRFVANYTTKRFAHPTCREAKLAYIARKRRQMEILDEQRAAAEEGMMMALLDISDGWSKPLDAEAGDATHAAHIARVKAAKAAEAARQAAYRAAEAERGPEEAERVTNPARQAEALAKVHGPEFLAQLAEALLRHVDAAATQQA